MVKDAEVNFYDINVDTPTNNSNVRQLRTIRGTRDQRVNASNERVLIEQ